MSHYSVCSYHKSFHIYIYTEYFGTISICNSHIWQRVTITIRSVKFTWTFLRCQAETFTASRHLDREKYRFGTEQNVLSAFWRYLRSVVKRKISQMRVSHKNPNRRKVRFPFAICRKRKYFKSRSFCEVLKCKLLTPRCYI